MTIEVYLDPEAVTDGIVKNYSLVTDPQEVGEIANQLNQMPMFALDLETTGLDHHRSSIHGVALATETQEWYVCMGAEKALMPHIAELVKEKQVIMHNAAFDCHFLMRYGIRPLKLIDTMLAEYLVDENQSISLKRLSKNKLGIQQPLPSFKELLREAKKLTGKKVTEATIYDIPLHKLAIYAARDARLTFDLWPIAAYELQQEGMTENFWETEMPFVQLILDMEEAGFLIDQSILAQLEVEFTEKKDAAYKRWMELSDGVNPNSHDQLANYVYNVLGFEVTRTTDSGKPSVDAISLARLKHEDKTGSIQTLLELRNFEKLITTYVIAFREQLYNGRLHCNYNQTGTVTGRLSSSGPNLQNVPVTGEYGSQIRKAFIALAGFDFMLIDYSQIELRLVAHYTRDENLLRVFAENGDPHQMTADFINKMGYNITRKQAKSVNFGWAYRIGARGLQDNIEKSTGSRPAETDTKAWLDGFSKAYPNAPRWSRRVIEYARELGYVKTIAGRKRRLPEINSRDRSLSAQAERQAINSIIQGSAADIIKWAMLRMPPVAQRHGAKLLSQVHDELDFECPTAQVQDFGTEASTLMCAAGEHFNLRVKLLADPASGSSWADAKG
jgi:DNA polymerase-1